MSDWALYSKNKKFVSIKTKLVLLFGGLIIVSAILLGLTAVHLSKQAVLDRVTERLTEKAKDTATIIDGKVDSVFQFLDGVARAPIVYDNNVPIEDKLNYLRAEVKQNEKIASFGIGLPDGSYYSINGAKDDVRNRDWFGLYLISSCACDNR